MTAREVWIEAQLIHTFMRHARPALHSALMLTAIIVAILYRYVEPVRLWLWATSAIVITLIRYCIINIYQRKLMEVNGPPLHAFMERYAWTWSLSAMIWGSSMFVFYLKAPIYDQLICMTVLIGIAVIAASAFSPCLRCFSNYCDGLCVSVLAAIAYQPALESGSFFSAFNAYREMVLGVLFWAVIRKSGLRFHKLQRVHFELQFDHSKLIVSLTEKTHAALKAIETRNRFIASAAYDLRQPVDSLRLYASWLTAEPEFASQIASKIVKSTQAINNLFDSIFDLAGLNPASLRVKVQPVNLVTLVQELEIQYAPLALERGLRLRTRTAQGQEFSDPELLKRLVSNILSNALMNTYKGGVLLAVRRRLGAWRIEVWGSGKGIASERQQTFFQGIPEQGTEEGFGLDLAIIYRLSQILGHPVGMTSRTGGGSVFWVELRPPRRHLPN